MSCGRMVKLGWVTNGSTYDHVITYDNEVRASIT
jgi:hypothetical protein